MGSLRALLGTIYGRKCFQCQLGLPIASQYPIRFQEVWERNWEKENLKKFERKKIGGKNI